MKTQHQNREFGHTQGEIFKKNLPKKSIIVFKGSSNSENHQLWAPEPEFDHTRGEIKKKPAKKKYISVQRW
jgi:hypothetical protein